MNIERDICGNCPTKCMEWDGSELTIDDSELREVHALHQRHAQGAPARNRHRRHHPRWAPKLPSSRVPSSRRFSFPS